MLIIICKFHIPELPYILFVGLSQHISYSNVFPDNPPCQYSLSKIKHKTVVLPNYKTGQPIAPAGTKYPDHDHNIINVGTLSTSRCKN
jgi:hypothetical protein